MKLSAVGEPHRVARLIVNTGLLGLREYKPVRPMMIGMVLLRSLYLILSSWSHELSIPVAPSHATSRAPRTRWAHGHHSRAPAARSP